MILVSMISGELAGSILFGVFIGNMVARFFSMDPIGLIIGIFIGVALGTYSVKTTLDWFYNQEKQENE